MTCIHSYSKGTSPSQSKAQGIVSSGVPLSLPITMTLNWMGLYSSFWFSGWGEAKRVDCLTNQTEQINPSLSTWPQAGANRELLTQTSS